MTRTAGTTSSGEYKGKPASPDTVKKTVEFQGLKIKIDRPKGFVMRGSDSEGQPWERVYKYDYGFIDGTEGGDGDGLDVFLGPVSDDKEVYWARLLKHDGSFDEYKVFLGFGSRDAAIAAFREHIPLKLLGGMVTLKLNMMKAMLGLMPSEDLAKEAMFFAMRSELKALLEARS